MLILVSTSRANPPWAQASPEHHPGQEPRPPGSKALTTGLPGGAGPGATRQGG